MSGKSFRSSASTTRVADYDVTDDRGYLDDKSFQAFCLQVQAVIYDHPEGLWLAQILRRVGNARQLCDAIEVLLGNGAIKASDKMPTRYMPAVARPGRKGKWNGADHIH